MPTRPSLRLESNETREILQNPKTRAGSLSSVLSLVPPSLSLYIYIFFFLSLSLSRFGFPTSSLFSFP